MILFFLLCTLVKGDFSTCGKNEKFRKTFNYFLSSVFALNNRPHVQGNER